VALPVSTTDPTLEAPLRSAVMVPVPAWAPLYPLGPDPGWWTRGYAAFWSAAV
jgi:hypothetical protein